MSVPKTQKAIVLHAVGSRVVLEERPVPEPGEGQLLVKVIVAGCRFLLHFEFTACSFCLHGYSSLKNWIGADKVDTCSEPP
jgi:Zn-dependent alcohol dehydrogenases